MAIAPQFQRAKITAATRKSVQEGAPISSSISLFVPGLAFLCGERGRTEYGLSRGPRVPVTERNMRALRGGIWLDKITG